MFDETPLVVWILERHGRCGFKQGRGAESDLGRVDGKTLHVLAYNRFSK